MTDAILAIDCGTSGVKSTLIIRGDDSQHTVLPPRKTEAQTTNVESRLIRLWNPEQLIRSVTDHIFDEVIRADEHNAQIVAIVPTTTTSSLVALKGARIADIPQPMRWDDRQAIAEAEILERIRLDTSAFPWMNPISPESGIAKALFLLRTHHHTLHTDDIAIHEQWSLLTWWLTGKAVQSESITARKWGFTKSRPWPTEFEKRVQQVLTAYMPPECGPPINWFRQKFVPGELLSAGDCVGPISYVVREALGLPFGAKVFAAPYDACAQVIGLGLLDSLDYVAVALGTSLGITALVSGDEEHVITHACPIPDVPTRDDRMLFDGFASCGSAIEHVCNQHSILNANGEPDLTFISEALQQTEPGAKGFVMLPFFNGGRRTTHGDHKSEAGIYFGTRVGIGKAEYVKGLFESFGFQIRTVVDDFEKAVKREFRTLLVAGGPAKSRPFMQMLADITGRKVSIGSYADSSLIGCAICAAVGLGWYSSLREASKAMVKISESFTPSKNSKDQYNNLYQQYLDMFRAELAGGQR